MTKKVVGKDTLYCSFCKKSQHEVKKLIAGPVVFICDECVALCIDIIMNSDNGGGRGIIFAPEVISAIQDDGKTLDLRWLLWKIGICPKGMTSTLLDTPLVDVLNQIDDAVVAAIRHQQAYLQKAQEAEADKILTHIMKKPEGVRIALFQKLQKITHQPSTTE